MVDDGLSEGEVGDATVGTVGKDEDASKGDE